MTPQDAPDAPRTKEEWQRYLMKQAMERARLYEKWRPK